MILLILFKRRLGRERIYLMGKGSKVVDKRERK
jgi:hypothetical protein